MPAYSEIRQVAACSSMFYNESKYFAYKNYDIPKPNKSVGVFIDKPVVDAGGYKYIFTLQWTLCFRPVFSYIDNDKGNNIFN